MTNNKAIEEIEKMSAIMSNASYADCAGTPLIPESQGICDKVDCHTCKQARRLLNVGYRRQSEIAKEIFEEIEKLAFRLLNDKNYVIGDMIWDITEIKKKYTEELGNDR